MASPEYAGENYLADLARPRGDGGTDVTARTYAHDGGMMSFGSDFGNRSGRLLASEADREAVQAALNTHASLAAGLMDAVGRITIVDKGS